MFNISIKKLDRRTDIPWRHIPHALHRAVKIAIFTYPCLYLPWGRPCGNHAKRCMNKKTIQCLPNTSQHVLMYLQLFPSYTMLKSMRKSKNRYFHVPQTTFLFLLKTPLRLSRNMLHGWKDNSVLVKPLAACTHLSATVSQLFDAQVQKIAIFTYRCPHFCFSW